MWVGYLISPSCGAGYGEPPLAGGLSMSNNVDLIAGGLEGGDVPRPGSAARRRSRTSTLGDLPV